MDDGLEVLPEPKHVLLLHDLLNQRELLRRKCLHLRQLFDQLRQLLTVAYFIFRFSRLVFGEELIRLIAIDRDVLLVMRCVDWRR